MAIRFDPSYNAKITKIVKNFNQKRNRAIRKGKKNVPPILRVSELKRRYDTRKDLDRELNIIQKFNNDKALEEIETAGGAKAIRWDFDHLRSNIRKAKEFYDRELYEARHVDTNMKVTQAEYINNLIIKRSYLDLELAELSQSEYNTYKATIEEYLSSNERNLNAYRGWLKEVEVIMRNLGYDNKTINSFFDGFDKLTPRQFVELYRNNALVSRIYELYIPNPEGRFELSLSEDEAKQLIETFMDKKQEMIEKAKKEDALTEKAIKEVEEENRRYFKEFKDERNIPMGEWMDKKREELKNDPKKLKEFDEWMKMTE